ncbi:MAG: glycosyltransferase family 1 protein [Candidatus Gastranaerophilales bacterium]|nr:glycosyltransferase family 1 protein [Candidatus Gastranaerophilales bacterium]
MKKILAILPHSIGGRLTTSSIIDGFLQNDFDVVVFDELKQENFADFINLEYDYIVGYDFSPIKLKIDYNLKTPCIAYFSDVIEEKTSGVGYLEYNKYLNNSDIYVFYWDRELSKNTKYFYQPHFVNTKIYKNFLIPKNDVVFMGRLDTDLRLNLFIELNKLLPEYSFSYYAIEKHFQDALSRLNDNDKKILKECYRGFIDNEKDMAKIINEAKIVYNINSQGIGSLNYRTMQVLACERLLISDKRKELDLFNNIVPEYKNIEDLAEKIRYYLNNPNEYLKITKNCRKIIEEKLDSKICIKNMLLKIQGE